jgi:aspartate carbamoyltransferase catalytic subunit
LLAQKVNCACLNSGDGRHEHRTQALLDALASVVPRETCTAFPSRHFAAMAQPRGAINIMLLGKMENRVRLVAARRRCCHPSKISGVSIIPRYARGLGDVDVVMSTASAKERMDGGFIHVRTYSIAHGLDAEKLSFAKPTFYRHAPGPMNRGVEIDGSIADDINRSVIQGRNGRCCAHGRDGSCGAIFGRRAGAKLRGHGLTVRHR